MGEDREESRSIEHHPASEERLEMKGECSRCKRPLTVESASSAVARTGIGRCRSCENEHTKGRSRTLGGRYTLVRSQAKFNNHKWELSFQQYAAIVASGKCFSAIIRFRQPQPDWTEKRIKTTRGILYSLAVESSRGPLGQEAATKRKATRLLLFFSSFVDGMKDRGDSRRSKIL